MNFKEKTVIITGGSEGVGAAAARKFAAAGAHLLLVARGVDKLQNIAVELRDQTRVETYALDVSNTQGCIDMLKKADSDFGRIDVLVNNAGYHERGPVESVSADDLGKMVDVNLRAPIVLTRLAMPYFRKAGGGAVINVASLAGRTPVPGSATYSATKAGLRAFTYALADELTGEGIKLAVVSPGPIDTGFIMSDIDNVSDLTFSQPISTADEVAQAILDLCGNDARELAMPRMSGVLTNATYMMPWLGRLARPLLERKGQRVKQRLKSEATRGASS